VAATALSGNVLHVDMAFEHRRPEDEHPGMTLVLLAHDQSPLKGAIPLIGLLGVQDLVVRIDARLDLPVQYQLHHLVLQIAHR